MSRRLRRGDWIVMTLLALVLAANLWARAAVPARTTELRKLTEALERNTMAVNQRTMAELEAAEAMWVDRMSREDIPQDRRDRFMQMLQRVRQKMHDLEASNGN